MLVFKRAEFVKPECVQEHWAAFSGAEDLLPSKRAYLPDHFRSQVPASGHARSRRLRLWTDVYSGEKPAIFQYERDDVYSNGGNYHPKVEMSVDLFVYIDAGKDQSIAPITVPNPLIDAIDAVLKPDIRTNRQTLGGLVSHCYIDGKIMKDPGDIDGDGIALIPIKLLATV